LGSRWRAPSRPRTSRCSGRRSERLAGLIERTPSRTLALLPDFGDWGLTLTILIIPLTVQWWSVWYPGAEPGGGSYIAQRMLASRSEKDALAGTFFFNVAHYALRPWPWIIVALSSMLVFPELEDIRRTFPWVDPALIGHDMAYPAMLTFLPAGFLGLIVAGLLSAYVSTISTHLNWGTSYLVHDLSTVPSANASEALRRGRRLVTIRLMVGAVAFTHSRQPASVRAADVGRRWNGLLYLLRWFWWRVNAWSEIAAMIASFAVAVGFAVATKAGASIPAHVGLLVTIATTTVVWIAVTYLAPPTDRPKLLEFYRLVRPAGPGWASVRAEARLGPSPDSLPQALASWVAGCALVYSALFGTGNALYGHTAQALVCGVVFVAAAVTLTRLIRTASPS
jgi:Na+/proline symporter